VFVTVAIVDIPHVDQGVPFKRHRMEVSSGPRMMKLGEIGLDGGHEQLVATVTPSPSYR
jgi:hypothetical protein